MGGHRYLSTRPRTYSEALALLAQLQSNRQITNLFDSKKPAASTAGSSMQSLNATAIPEMRDWLRRAGYTSQDLARLRHIHVAGTKGKGSVCAYATAMLRQYGKVGTYTSPHLVSVRERIAIDGEPVSQEVFAAAFFELWERFTEAAMSEGKDAAEAEGPATKPFFFRFLTILAWHIFLREKVDGVVLECGIGGEYDATNVLPAEAVSAAVVTQLGIDHVAMLGDTVEKIAWHKAGVFKPGVKGFTRNLDRHSSVKRVLRERAAEKGAQLVEVDDDAVERWGGVPGRLAGEFQKYNQALAVLAVREYLGLGSEGATAALQNIPDRMVDGLRDAKLRGRCEIIQEGPTRWHLDGAHTKDSLEQVARWFCQTLAEKESAILIFNQQERNAAELLAGFVDAVRKISGREDVFLHAIFTRNNQAKAAEGEVRDMDVQRRAAVLMNQELPECLTGVVDNIDDAVARTRELAGGRSAQKVLVTGSLHLIGGVLRALEPESLL